MSRLICTRLQWIFDVDDNIQDKDLRLSRTLNNSIGSKFTVSKKNDPKLEDSELSESCKNPSLTTTKLREKYQYRTYFAYKNRQDDQCS